MRLFVLFLLCAACAHAPPPEVEAKPVETGKVLQLSADTTPPVRKSCKQKGPHLADGDRVSGNIVVDYLVSAEGKVSGVTVKGDASAGAVRALRRYIESCRYAPATRNGTPVAVQWKGELSFPDATRAPGPR